MRKNKHRRYLRQTSHKLIHRKITVINPRLITTFLSFNGLSYLGKKKTLQATIQSCSQTTLQTHTNFQQNMTKRHNGASCHATKSRKYPLKSVKLAAKP